MQSGCPLKDVRQGDDIIRSCVFGRHSPVEWVGTHSDVTRGKGARRQAVLAAAVGIDRSEWALWWSRRWPR